MELNKNNFELNKMKYKTRKLKRKAGNRKVPNQTPRRIRTAAGKLKAEPKILKNTNSKHEQQKRRKEGEESAHEDGCMVG